MKIIKTLFIINAIFINTLSFSQLSMGINADIFNKNTQKASNIGSGISFSIKKIYLDFATNFAEGKGDQLNFKSSATYPLNKVMV